MQSDLFIRVAVRFSRSGFWTSLLSLENLRRKTAARGRVKLITASLKAAPYFTALKGRHACAIQRQGVLETSLERLGFSSQVYLGSDQDVRSSRDYLSYMESL